MYIDNNICTLKLLKYSENSMYYKKKTQHINDIHRRNLANIDCESILQKPYLFIHIQTPNLPINNRAVPPFYKAYLTKGHSSYQARFQMN